MKLCYYMSSVVVVALLSRVSEAVPLLPWSSTDGRHRLARRDLVDSLERLEALQTSLKDVDDGVAEWRRDRRQSQPPNWLGTHAAGTAWDAYVRMLRQEQLNEPRRTSNPVNFLGKRAAYFK